MSRMVIFLAEITIFFMEVVRVELNIMIIGGMLMATLVVGLVVSFDEKKEERRRQRQTRDIWGRA